jgi:predicted O-methyltransferase YrrM
MDCTDGSAVNSRKQIEILVVESNPADTYLTVEGFKAAGLTSGLRCVTDGDDALMYVRGEGKYAGVPIPDLIFLDLSHARYATPRFWISRATAATNASRNRMWM